jgi:hypothetical protein
MNADPEINITAKASNTSKIRPIWMDLFFFAGSKKVWRANRNGIPTPHGSIK